MSAMRSELEDWARFLRLDANVLIRRPDLLLQQAANQPAATATAIRATRFAESGRRRRPWLRWVNKPDHRDPIELTFTAGRYWVTACRFTLDGTGIVTLAGETRWWEATTGSFRAAFESSLRTTALGLSHDGRMIATGHSGSRYIDSGESPGLRVRGLESGETIALLDHGNSSIQAVAFSRDDRYLATGTEDQQVRIFDTRDFHLLHSLVHTNRPQACRFSPGRPFVAVAGGSWNRNYDVIVWDAESGRVVSKIAHEADVFDCAFSPDGLRLVTACGDNTLGLWDVASGKKLLTLTGHTFVVRACDWSSDGALIVSGSGDGTVRIWDSGTGATVGVGRKHTSQVFSCAFSRDSRRIVSGDQDNNCIVWDVRAMQSTSPAESSSMYGGSFSPNGRYFAAAASGAADLFDVATGSKVRSLEGDEGDFYYSCAWSPDMRRLAASSHKGMLIVWDLESGKRVFSTRVSPENVGHAHTCAFSPDGRWLGAAAYFVTKIWDAATLSLARTFEYEEGIPWFAFLDDPGHLIDADRNVWNIITGARVSMIGPPAPEQNSYDLSNVSPDGRKYVSRMDRELRVHAAKDASIHLAVPGEYVGSAFSMDSQRLITTSRSGDLSVLDARLGTEIAHFIAPGPLGSVAGGVAHMACGITNTVYLLELVN